MEKRKLLAVGLVAVFFCLQCVETFRAIPEGQRIFDLTYQFGPYSFSLMAHGEYADCSQTPCKVANRMPILPLTLAGLGALSTFSRPVAVIKNLLLACLVAFALCRLMDAQAAIFPGPRAAAAWWALAPLALSPELARHAAMITYEEGLLAELLLLWSLSFLFGAWQWLSPGHGRRTPLAAACLVLATACYLTKDSMLLPLLASLLLALLWWARFRGGWTAAALLLSAGLVLGWGLHNQEASGRFSIASSWDGENLYRGFSQDGYSIYPYASLDEVMGPLRAVALDDGRTVRVGFASRPVFKDEWAWDDHFKALAAGWIRAHPRELAAFQFRKFRNFYFSLVDRPRYPPYDAADRLWVRIGLGVERLMQAALLVLLSAVWRRGPGPGRGLVAAVLLVNLSYALPYLLCFNYERHIAVYAVVVAASLCALASALLSNVSGGRPLPGL